MHQWVVLKNNIKIYIKIFIKTAPVLLIHQLMHQWVVLKNSIKIYIKTYIKTAPTCFGVTDTNLYILLCIQWKPPDAGQRNCRKHAEF
jgi:hypothetical protein